MVQLTVFAEDGRRRPEQESTSSTWPGSPVKLLLSGVIVPGGETTFYIADRKIGTVSDPDFGSAFLAIWLDPDTRFPQQRSSLLSGMNASKSDYAGIEL
jgi:hypothetical protein